MAIDRILIVLDVCSGYNQRPGNSNSHIKLLRLLSSIELTHSLRTNGVKSARIRNSIAEIWVLWIFRACAFGCLSIHIKFHSWSIVFWGIPCYTSVQRCRLIYWILFSTVIRVEASHMNNWLQRNQVYATQFNAIHRANLGILIWI